MTIDALFSPSVKYTFTITAVNQNFHGNKSAPSYLLYDPDSILSKVQNVQLSDMGQNRIRLTWDEAKGNIEEYLVTLKSSNPFDFGNQEFTTKDFTGNCFEGEQNKTIIVLFLI